VDADSCFLKLLLAVATVDVACRYCTLAIGVEMGRVRLQLNSSGIGHHGTIDSPQRWYGEPGTVELVELAELESAVVDEGGLAGAWQEFAVHAKWHGKVDP
jgi:hypothetical protein